MKKILRNCLALCLAPGLAFSQSKSFDYELTYHGTGAGFQVQQLSVEYQIEASATSASVTGVGTAMLDIHSLVVRAGDAGQIFHPGTNASFSTSRPTVGETEMLQLLGELDNDDGSNSPLPSDAVGWMGQDPVGFISLQGRASFNAVITNTPASVTADYQGQQFTVNFTVLDNDKDNFDIYAFDQLPDLWQQQAFPPFSVLIRAQDDFDNDGRSNLSEYLFVTNPATNDVPFFAHSRTNQSMTNYVTIRYRERKNAAFWRIGVTLSPILGPGVPWTELGVSTSTISDHGTYLLKEASIPAIGARGFLRLEPFSQ